MNDDDIRDLFLDFWRDSYPSSPPGVHAINTHVGFGAYLLDRLEQLEGEE